MTKCGGYPLKIRLFQLSKTSNGCHQATHNVMLHVAHFSYPDSKTKTDIPWIRIFVSALMYTPPEACTDASL